MPSGGEVHRAGRTADAAQQPPPRCSKILIHGINFFPEFIGVGKYTGELAFFLAGRGHDVEVVAAPPHYPGWTVKAPYKPWRYQREAIGAVNVWRCPILAMPNGGGLWRALAPLSFAALAAPFVFARILLRRPDVVVCVEPTLFSAPAALLAGKLVGATTVLHVQDLEIDAAFGVSHLRGDRLRGLAERLERALLRAFDRTVTISHKMREALVARGAPPASALVVRNWVDLNAIFPLPADRPNRFRRELGLVGKFVALYAGHIGAKQALHVVLEAARLCRDRQDLHFVVAGEGPKKAALMERFAELPNVSFLPLQPDDRFNELLALADLHLLPQDKGVADLVLPSKLGGMLASGRPILAMVEPATELALVLEDAALLTPTGDFAAFAEGVKRAAASDLRDLVARGGDLAALLSADRLLPAFEHALVASRKALADGLEDALVKRRAVAKTVRSGSGGWR